jgi:hypothetical protein
MERVVETGQSKIIKPCWIHKQVKKGSTLQLLEVKKWLARETLTALMGRGQLCSPKLQEQNPLQQTTTSVAQLETGI